MRWAKLINGIPQYAQRKVRYNGATVYNPTDTMLLELGYKPVTFTDMPDAPEGWNYVLGWSELSDKIVQTWTLEELPPERDIDPEEALKILMGGLI